jgi:hypothetical protein
METDLYSDSAYTADISTRMRVPDRWARILIPNFKINKLNYCVRLMAPNGHMDEEWGRV